MIDSPEPGDLDARLIAWATAPAAGDDAASAAAAAARVLAAHPAARPRRWATGFGAAIAAAVAGAVLFWPAAVPTLLPPPVEITDEQAFAALFTTTPQEDDVI